MNKFNVGDIIRNNISYSNNFTYLVTEIPSSVDYRYIILCLDKHQTTWLPKQYESNYDIVERAT
jgi:hypothetical protein